ncbi:unnamed protein product [Rotaria sp. Silwood1]|nr:unnamed protein product [Rotaria sp. Silwood1]CAF0738612.1 unnamed protein product [Rotaria sp. Silwood1]CAF3349078.1 unnamed protein product [Rotaria sp. Silwood1]CAF3353111.1 unnamed protein product [Rotaria sp. Silwood1]CAF4685836.1 unnamed protein product [Rotaria sp. Silwood1]
MCDRLCMAFSLKELQALIQLRDADTTIGPNYVELGTKLKPIQTYNALRNSPCPILLSEKHIYDGIPSNSTVLAIMQWGLLLSWKIEGKTKSKYRIANTVNTPTNISHRIAPYIPAIFNSIQQALDWIDFDCIDMNEALKLLENHQQNLVIDLVSNHVFKRSNTGLECIEIICESTIEKSSTNIKSEDDIDMKIIEKPTEDIEQQHENASYQQKKKTLSKAFE